MLDRKFRYLCAGGFNTACNYFVSLASYHSLIAYFHIIVISLITNIIAINISFLTFKFFVFKTNGNWISEYKKNYIVYSWLIVFNVILIWILVDFMKMPYWLGLIISMGVVAILGYKNHTNFTFKTLNDHK
jgi:putative flippase GtrA